MHRLYFLKHMLPLPNQQCLPHKHPCVVIVILGIRATKWQSQGPSLYKKNPGSNLLSILLKINHGSRNKDVPVYPLFWLNTVISSSMQTVVVRVQPNTINKWT